MPVTPARRSTRFLTRRCGEKKVRITCKHCGTAIVVDGMNLPAATEASAANAQPKVNAQPKENAQPKANAQPKVNAQPNPQPVPPLELPNGDRASEDDLTLIARSKFGQDLSVHDEPTVIGQIPREALDFERTFAQRAEPSPSEGAAPVPEPAAESAVAALRLGAPFGAPGGAGEPRTTIPSGRRREAFARSEPPTDPNIGAPLPLRAPLASLPPAPPPAIPTVLIKDTRDEPTLISRAAPGSRSPAAAVQRQRAHLARVAPVCPRAAGPAGDWCRSLSRSCADLLPLGSLDHAHQDHGDVVFAAPLVGSLDQRVDGVVELGLREHDREHLVVAQHLRQAVRAQQVDVVRTRLSTIRSMVTLEPMPTARTNRCACGPLTPIDAMV